MQEKFQSETEWSLLLHDFVIYPSIHPYSFHPQQTVIFSNTTQPPHTTPRPHYHTPNSSIDFDCTVMLYKLYRMYKLAIIQTRNISGLEQNCPYCYSCCCEILATPQNLFGPLKTFACVSLTQWRLVPFFKAARLIIIGIKASPVDLEWWSFDPSLGTH